MIVSQSLLNKLIKCEMEKLGISKKYTGFKYLAELLEFLLNNPLQSLTDGFNAVSELNGVSVDTLEHAVKNMLFTCLKQNLWLQEIIPEGSNSRGFKLVIMLIKDNVYKSIA